MKFLGTRNVDWRTEAAAGVTTFFTMAYIVVVNPSILAAPGTGMPFAGVMTATVLLSFVMTLSMGLYAKLPFAVAPGMGINAFFAFIESAAGIEAGGRTGWTAVFAALCFLPCLFLAPLAAMVPPFATAPILILVGALMFRSVSALPLEKLEDAVPAFLTLVLIPLTFSITQGILWGFVSHVALYALAGRALEVRPLLWGLAAVSVVLLRLH